MAERLDAEVRNGLSYTEGNHQPAKDLVKCVHHRLLSCSSEAGRFRTLPRLPTTARPSPFKLASNSEYRFCRRSLRTAIAKGFLCLNLIDLGSGK
jgi:hypothetical protein